MQAIILAAGMGRRLGDLTKDKPKCMLKINGKTLIERAVRSLLSNGIKKIIIVVGHRKEVLQKHLKEVFQGVDFIYIENEDYKKTNNIYSLYLTINEFKKDDTILLESDIIFEDSIIKDLIASPYENVAVVDKYQSWMDGSVVLIDREGFLSTLIPKENFNFSNIDSYYKTVNIYKFSKNFINKVYVPFLEAYVKAIGNNEYYEQVIKIILSLDKIKIKALNLNNRKLWYEIDTIQDLNLAKIIFSQREEKYNKLQKLYGGYWKFNDVIDFYYLSNPYFPTKQFIDELKYSFNILINNYPSGQSIQNELISMIFNINKSYVLSGNGASEFIKILPSVLKGPFVIPIPTFDEYINAIRTRDKIFFIETKEKDFRYSIEDIIEHDNFKKAKNIILINPDNPSGNFIEKLDMIKLLEILQREGKFLILDESFIEFADIKESLLKNEILENYKNLIIIKSLSKSYGIAGIRLGLLASSNKEVFNKIRSILPIWNINSFAEYFLQKFDKYRNDFLLSCEEIRKERKYIINYLNKEKSIKVYPSQGNFIMMKLKNASSKDFVNIMLEKFGIFIKDLNGKLGIYNENMVRIAVRNEEDNRLLIKALDEVLNDRNKF